jgi:hypothetical protein
MGVKKLHRHGLPVGNFLLPQENMIFFKNIKNVPNSNIQSSKKW